jgi:hypothetical protein
MVMSALGAHGHDIVSHYRFIDALLSQVLFPGHLLCSVFFLLMRSVVSQSDSSVKAAG